MLISLNWLATHLDLEGVSTEEIDRLLTFAGVEVEGIESTGVASPLIVVAQIKDAQPHPNADRLNVCMADAGEGELRQIVCGAKNYQVGDKVPCALPGAELPGGFTIKETKMRGVESRGMLCAASEIGMTDAEDGLMILPADFPVGKPLAELFSGDTRIEVEVTPNRPDLLSHRGVAREVAVLLEKPLAPLDIPQRESEPAGPDAIRLDDPAGCPFYTVVRISGVKVGPSPDWLAERLEAIGLRPINNIVDITNFVLHELGHPLHAFDAAKVSGAIVVRRAADGEKFLALDGETYTLETEDIVISDDAGHALALGGVMGGEDSGVVESTTDIILESAWFTPQDIRRTSRRLALSSDSSYRFERGADPQGALPASALAVKLIAELAGGTAEPVALAAGEAPVRTQPVALDPKKLDQLTGGAVPLGEAESILARLGLAKRDDGLWDVPSCRADLQRHIDLVEEITRVFGLDRIPGRDIARFVPSSKVDHAHDRDMALRRALAALGLYECRTIKLISETQLTDALPLRPLRDGDVIRVALPLSEEHSVMRPSLIPGIVATAERNHRHGAEALRFFELGRTFRNAGGGKARDLEADTLGLLVSGPVRPDSWAETPENATIHDLLAIVAALLPRHSVALSPRERDGFALACDVVIDGKPCGVAARLLPARERALDFPAPAFVAEIDLAKLRALPKTCTRVADLPQFPGSSRDLALEAPADLPAGDIQRALAKANEPLLAEFRCFDVFRDPTGERLPADRKSLAYRLLYRTPERTLKAGEVDAAHAKVVAMLTKKLPVKVR
jgi:phenylalanyl-tRNA synthetase beta chain